MRLPFLKSKPEGKLKPVVLVILDGFGVAPASDGNAIHLAKSPNYDRFLTEYPNTQLIAAGESVGLPANEVGNSEVGHLTIGAGRVILQSLKKINSSIEDGSFFENDAFNKAVDHVYKNNSHLHIMGLASTGSVHSSLLHLHALIEFCLRHDMTGVYLHLFTDGRDAPPKTGIKVIEDIETRLKDSGIGTIASVSGRYYAMDRDARWDRIKMTYDAMVLGKGLTASTAVESIRASYDRNETDEFVKPTIIRHPGGNFITVNDNDAVIFFNFRIDRPRQLTMAFVMPDFEKIKSIELEHVHGQDTTGGDRVLTGTTFHREKLPKNLYFVTMTQYQKNLPVSNIAFPPETCNNPLPKILSDKGLRQFHLAESEKDRMVRFYMNGLSEKAFPGEDDLIVPSQKVDTYDKKPEMSAYDILKELKKALEKDKYHFIVLNIANPDMVAHSGNIKATIRAIEHVDKVLGEMESAILAKDGTMLITADHGNAEELLTFPMQTYYYTTQIGEFNTDHSNNPVPFVIMNKSLANSGRKMKKGSLSDVAPTVLALMGFSKHPEMQGDNLLETPLPTAKPSAG
jgi:2,3-bisphosphoglycerate-independent phosphoglycerate mutase